MLLNFPLFFSLLNIFHLFRFSTPPHNRKSFLFIFLYSSQNPLYSIYAFIMKEMWQFALFTLTTLQILVEKRFAGNRDLEPKKEQIFLPIIINHLSSNCKFIVKIYALLKVFHICVRNFNREFQSVVKSGGHTMITKAAVRKPFFLKMWERYPKTWKTLII
jgi:hypothetical protein